MTREQPKNAPEARSPDSAAQRRAGPCAPEGAPAELCTAGEGRSPPPAAWRRAVRDFLFGMFGYEAAQTALEMRESLEKIFVLSTFGDMLGVPVLPPYYGLRLLPWMVPHVAAWKRRFARERELGDSHEYHLHGV